MARATPTIPHPSAALVASDRIMREWLIFLETLVDRFPIIGSATFPGGGPTTIAVTLSPAERDTNYRVFVEEIANRNYWITSKATTGFTLNQSASVNETVGYLLLRY